MNAFSTDTIPTKSPFYKDTAEAYSCSPLILYGWEEKEPNQFNLLYNNDSINHCHFTPKVSDQLTDLLLCQFKKTVNTKNQLLFLSFVMHRAIQMAQSNVSTAPLEMLPLKNIRRYMATLNSKLTDQSNRQDILTTVTISDAIPVPCSRIDLIYDYCKPEDQPTILRYFSTHQNLINIVKEGLEKVKDIFGTNTKFRLKIVQDKEYLASPKLFVYIILSELVENPYSILDKFDSEWYLSQSDEFLDLVAFNIWQ